MCCDQSGRRWAWPVAGFIVISILTGTGAILTAGQQGQQGNRVAAGDAATVGQRPPGPSSRPDLQARDLGVHFVAEDAMQARQQRELRKMRFEQMKQHASQLADMARSLQQDIEKSNEHILSAEVNEKAKKIEKLAGKIRSEARY